MKMIKQPTDITGCGVAVIAMLRESNYKAVMDVMEPNRDSWFKRGTEHMTIPQMKAALDQLMRGFHVRSGRKWPVGAELAAVYVETQHKLKHWVAFDGTHYYDPLSTAKGPTTRINRRVAGYVALYPCRSQNSEVCDGC